MVAQCKFVEHLSGGRVPTFLKWQPDHSQLAKLAGLSRAKSMPEIAIAMVKATLSALISFVVCSMDQTLRMPMARRRRMCKRLMA